MALQQSKVSKMKKRMRLAPRSYQGVATADCPACGAARLPHRVCPKCGVYKGRQIVTNTAE